MIRRYKDIAAKRRAVVSRAWICVLTLMIAAIIFSSLSPTAEAAQLANRSLYVGDTNPGVTTSHTFTFSYVGPDPVSSLKFEYCTTPFVELACATPPGIDASGAQLTAQSGETGFTLLSTQPNTVILSRSASVPTQNPSSYSFSQVVNPTGAPDYFYVRITTYQSADGTGAFSDFGAVVNSTTQAVRISTEVPPILKFCVGLVLASDCSTADESVIDLGDLSPTKASAGTSQMLAATNADFGLAIAVYGTTMTSGNNVIAALANPTVSAPGNAQFGLNLRKNTDPPIGQEPSGGGLTNPSTRYDIPNRYAFTTGDVVATSPDATDTRIFTASYLVNVPPSQTPGVYTSTLTYICTASF